jgi:hypothetical protein
VEHWLAPGERSEAKRRARPLEGDLATIGIYEGEVLGGNEQSSLPGSSILKRLGLVTLS